MKSLNGSAIWKIVLPIISFFVLAGIFYIFRELFFFRERNSFFLWDIHFFMAHIIPAEEAFWPSVMENYPLGQWLCHFFFQFYQGYWAYLIPSFLGTTYCMVTYLTAIRIFNRQIFNHYRKQKWIPSVFFLVSFILWIWINLNPSINGPIPILLFIQSLCFYFIVSFRSKSWQIIFLSITSIMISYIGGPLIPSIYLFLYFISQIPSIATGRCRILFPCAFLIILLANLSVSLNTLMKRNTEISVRNILSFHQRNEGFQWLKDPRLYLTTLSCERLLLEGTPEQAIETANLYWFTHPCPLTDVVKGSHSLLTHASEETRILRTILASYTKSALIECDRLSESFFLYYRVPEIYNHFIEPRLPFFHISELLRYQALGLPVNTFSQALNLIEKEGLSYTLLETSIPALLACDEKKLAATYQNLLSRTWAHKSDSTRFHKLTNRYKEFMPQSFNDYPEGTPEFYQTILASNPGSIPANDLMILYRLLQKQNDSALELIKQQLMESQDRNISHKVPGTWQEMIIIEALKKNNVRAQEWMQKIEISENVLKSFSFAEEVRKQWEAGLISPEELTRQIGHTFYYNYYFSQFVDVKTSYNPGVRASIPH